jgi:hypothetical protein
MDILRYVASPEARSPLVLPSHLWSTNARQLYRQRRHILHHYRIHSAVLHLTSIVHAIRAAMEQLRAGVLSAERSYGLSIGGNKRRHRRLRPFPSHAGYPQAEHGPFTKD